MHHEDARRGRSPAATPKPSPHKELRGVVSGEPKKKAGAADVSGSGAARLLFIGQAISDGAAVDGFAGGRLGAGGSGTG